MSVWIGKRMTNGMELTKPLQDVCWALLIDWGSNHIPVMMRLISSNLSMLISSNMSQDCRGWVNVLWHFGCFDCFESKISVMPLARQEYQVPGCHFSNSTFGSRHSSWFQLIPADIGLARINRPHLSIKATDQWPAVLGLDIPLGKSWQIPHTDRFWKFENHL